MTLITVPESLTGAPYLRRFQTIKKAGVDSKILEIYPIDRKVTSIPADITVVFNEAVTDVSVTNLIDTTVINLAYVSYYEDERDRYDYYKGKTVFPTTIKDKIYVLTWKYYFTKEHWVIFKLDYTDTNGNPLTYEFTIYNETPAKTSDYILAADQQP